MPSPDPEVFHTVTLHGGPLDGESVDLHEPWPRYGFFKLVVDGEDTRYYLRPTAREHADFVGPLEFRPEPAS